MKKLCIFLSCIITGYAFADQYFVSESGFPASRRTKINPWVFEFKNKTKNLLFIELYNGDTSYTEDTSNLGIARLSPSHGSAESEHGYVRIADPRFSPKLKTFVRIWKANRTGTIESPAFRSYEIAANGTRKQIFLTFENNNLVAQKGKYGKTQSGILLDNNVQNKDIKPETRATLAPEIPTALKNYFKKNRK